MIGKLLKGITGFKNKSERDVKNLQPIVDEINQHYIEYQGLDNDSLRKRTEELRSIIAKKLGETDAQIQDLKSKIKLEWASNVEEKEQAYEQIDKLEDDRNDLLEEVLEEILPQAFAIIKATARRFKELDEIEVRATDFDKVLALEKKHITIRGDKAIYQNEWEAAGALVKWNMIHYDVQLIGGISLHQGKIAEMATGEGKTLVSTLPAYLNALAGRGVHIVTVNDYLARRDCEWNAPIFQFHGLRVDCIDYYKPHSPQRREAYKADITYGTNNEFGFDYLRDNMAHQPDELVQRKHHYAMIDEVDSVLVDDARTPLIISGPVEKGDQHQFMDLKPRIQKLVDAQKRIAVKSLNEAKKLIKENKTGEKDGGLHLYRAFRGLPKNNALIKFLSETGMRTLLQKNENYFLQDQQKNMHIIDEELLFTIDEKNNQVELTDKGVEMITKEGEDKDFFVMTDVGAEMAELEKESLSEKDNIKRKDAIMRDFSVKSERIHSVNQLLKAYTLFEKDVEYILQDNKVKIVDEQTGRVMEGRRYSDGLHQAIEAKENVKVEAASQTYATVTLQNYFRMYHKLSGMTGTAETEAGEFWEIYKLDVVVIPTNKPIVRDDRHDLVYKTKREKYNAVIEEVKKLSAEGRPTLVGTTSVEVSETLSRMLKLRKIKHNVLNAKQHQREAEIVAEAGKKGAVTIATNMAGRGTDIKLSDEIKSLGGLAIIGTERHDSRRVDRQLRGRSGRQGDPGSSQFYVSLEDNLMRLFGSERVSNIMDRFGYEEGEVIQHSMITKTIERSQKKVENNNFGIRKRLLEYDDVMNKQREVIYARRRNALYGERMSVDINNALYDWVAETVPNFKDASDFEGFQLEVLRNLALETQINHDDFLNKNEETLTQLVFNQLSQGYQRKNEQIIEEALPVISNIFEQNKEEAENIVVPFSDGIKGVNVVTPMKEAIETEGQALINAFEKFVALSSIDNHWKEHLRELDDLKQAANTASYEQKDPLLIYKLESFNLFKSMMYELNGEVLSMLFKGNLPKQSPQVQQGANQGKRLSDSRLQTSRKSDLPTAQNQTQDNSQTQEKEKIPVKAATKVGRNDPCPCGSGKKYKKCHGANA